MPSETIPDVETKATTGQFNIDEAKGIVECFVAGIGNKDSVGDIVLPGAFDSSLKRRKPRVVWGHNWNEPIGKVLEIFEVPTSDPRLPAKMRNAGIGGLYARVQFNLKSERGREAFANVVFFGEEQEWSIGYKTLNADFDPQRQANLLREVELYEVSPVLHGANQLTATISIKADAPNELSVGDLVTWSASGGEAYGKVVKKVTDGTITAQPTGPKMEGTKEKPAIAVQVWKQNSSGEWNPINTMTVHRMDSLRQIDALPKQGTKSAKKEDRVTSFGKSKWPMFDRAFAERIKGDHKEIWDAGGNIKGDDQYTILTKIAEQGGVAKTEDQIKALELREAWIARHKGDFRLPGVIAQIKWLAIGSRGEAYMKNVVNDAIKSKKERKGDPSEYNPATGRAAQLARELSEKLGGPVKLVEIRDNEVDFEFNDQMWTTTWASPGDNGIVFGNVEPMTEMTAAKGAMTSQDEAIVSLFPQNPKDVAVKGGYEPEEIHMVVQKMGDPSEWTEEQRSMLEDAVEKWAMGMSRPVMGAVRFVDRDDDDDERVGYRMRVPEAEALRSQVSEISPYPTNERQDAHYEALEEVAEKFGKWDQGTGADGAHYVEKSPFKSEGLVCSNCVYYQGPRGCEVVTGDIAPDGVCKLWIIPEDLVKKPRGEKGAMMPEPVMVEDQPEEMTKNHWNGFMPVGSGIQAPESYVRIVPFNRVRVQWGPEMMREFGIGPKPAGGCGCGCSGKGNCSPDMGQKVSLTDVPGGEANTTISGDVLRGRGPRRGNLEALLRYWRPIMKAPGGFRRCVAELSDHPELAPWKPLCAWLHHETTGKWPNEGNHHGGGKGGRGVRRALRGRKTAWSEDYGMKTLEEEPMTDQLAEEEYEWAAKIMSHFAEQEPEFVKYIQSPSSWCMLDDDDNEMDMDDWKSWISSDSDCADCDDASEGYMGAKVGRQISSRNMSKLRQAADLLNEVVSSGDIMQKDADPVSHELMEIEVSTRSMFAVKELLDPIADYYGTSIKIDEINGDLISIGVKSLEQREAVNRVIGAVIPSKPVLGIDEKGMPIKPKKQQPPKKTRAVGREAAARYFHADMKAEGQAPTPAPKEDPFDVVKGKITEAVESADGKDPKELQADIEKMMGLPDMTPKEVPFLAGRDKDKAVLAGDKLTQEQVDEIRIAQQRIGAEADITIEMISAVDDVAKLDELNQMIVKDSTPSLLGFLLAEMIRMEKQVRQFEMSKPPEPAA